jgi:hypothetical protein
MRLIRIGPHTFRFDSIEYLFEHTDSVSKGGEASLTLFLRGRESGIELTAKEAEVLTRFLGRECAISDLMASEEPGSSLSEPATEVDWYLVVSPLCSYDQEALLRPRLGAIRRHYPGSRIMVQPSETAPATVARWRAATTDLEIDWLTPRPIHTPGSGVTPIGAMLEAYLGVPHPAEFLIKIDLDARVRRRFRRLPHRALGVFGSLEFFACSGFPYGDFPNVQGGCYGLSRETARRILDSGILSGPELRDNPGIWVDGVADWRHFPEHGRTLEDGLLRWATKRMGMRPFALGEIDSQFRPRAWDVAGDYAVTHPHKTLNPDESKAGEGWRFVAGTA